MKYTYLLPAILWFFIIFWIISMPPSSIPRTPLFSIPHFDKLVHTGMFTVFVIFLIFGFDKQSKGIIFRHRYTFSLIIGVIYSIGTEWYQYVYVPGREGEFWDIMANLVGCITGSLIFLYREKIVPGFIYNKF